MAESDWEITTLVLEEYADSLTEITKSHWQSADNRTACANKKCGRRFSLIDRKHHCRRCGDVFCNECLLYRRRLSFLAHYDPNGKLYKVCPTCFEEGENQDLCLRNLTDFFNLMKTHNCKRKAMIEVGQSRLSRSYRERIDLHKECARLREGFMKSIGTSEMRRTLHEMKGFIATPDWQKSSNWMMESLSQKCQNCSVGFTLMRKRYCCKLCGKALCKQCIRKELLIYVPDSINSPLPTEAELAIINIVGCPEIEPELSVLLHVCSLCRQFVIDGQLFKLKEDSLSEVTTVSVIEELRIKDSIISQLQSKIVNQLTQYQEIVESLEDGRRASGDGSNTKTLAKSQNDLADYFSTLVLEIPGVKKLLAAAETNTQRKLCGNYLKAKSDFYFEYLNTFKGLKRKLSDSASPELLEYIQKIVDKNAIVCAQIYVRQLIFESLHLCMKHSLKDLVPALLKNLDETIEEEANTCLSAQGDDVEDHRDRLKSIVKVQMKEHRLVKPSRRQLAAMGSRHVAELLLRQLCDVLEKVTIQLNMKSINRSFQRTKNVLQETRTAAAQVTANDLL